MSKKETEKSKISKKSTTNATVLKKSSTKNDQQDRRSLADKILIEYEVGGVTLESCCGFYGITARTLHNWIALDSEILQRYKRAKEKASTAGRELIREKALDGLTRLIVGYFIEEEEEVKIKDKAGNVTRTIITKRKKYFAPNPTSVIFALKNIDPTSWNAESAPLEDQEPQLFKIGDNTISF
jgi:hypothetical protein